MIAATGSFAFVCDASTKRKFTPEGFLVVPGTIARTGVQSYAAKELGLDSEGYPANKPVRLHRPHEEVFAPETLSSFDGKTITVGHPKDLVSADNWRNLSVGDVRAVRCEGDKMRAELVVRDAATIAAVQDGKNQLSCGYEFQLDLTPGTNAQGEAYDGVMRAIRGNHVAIVDVARGGSACRIADQQPEETRMATRKVTVLDGVSLEVDETTASVVEKLEGERQTAVKTATDATAKAREADDAVAAAARDMARLVADHAAEVEKIKAQIPTEAQIAERAGTMAKDIAKAIGDAAKLAPEVATDGKSAEQIRRDVLADVMTKNEVAKAVGDAALAGKTAADADISLVSATLSAIAVAVEKAKAVATDTALAAGLLGNDGKQNAEDAPVGRAAFIRNSQNAWRGEDR